jgi:nucleoid-associated protein YgaU
MSEKEDKEKDKASFARNRNLPSREPDDGPKAGQSGTNEAQPNATAPERGDDRPRVARREADATLDKPQLAQRKLDEAAMRRAEANERATSGARPEQAPSSRKHTVGAGETLSHISLKYYGTANRWQEIYEANKDEIGDNPNKIKAGQELIIPG